MKYPPQKTESAERPRWATRRLGTRLGYGIFNAMIRLGGRRLAYAALYCVVPYYVLLRPAIRKRSEPYLRHRFSGVGRLQRLVSTWRLFLNMGKVMIDRAVAGIIGMETFELEVRGKEELIALASKGSGFILLMSHVGCWQVAVSALGFLNRPVNLLLEHEAESLDRQYFEYDRPAARIKVIDPRGFLGGTLEMLDVLKRGEVLCVMGDRASGKGKSFVRVPFLGEPAPFPFSAFQIASAAGVPVVILFTHKTAPDCYSLNVANIITVPGNLGRTGNSYTPYVAQFAEELENYVQAHPFQFYNFYDMWD